jgi:hypothetical protein
VEWEADSLPKASLEIQNRPRLEFEGEQQRSDSELSSKPNLTIPIEENPQLDSDTSPPANESKDLMSEPCTQEMSLDSEINPPAYESKRPGRVRIVHTGKSEYRRFWTNCEEILPLARYTSETLGLQAIWQGLCSFCQNGEKVLMA